MWTFFSSILVLFLIIGLGLHSSGHVRAKNSVSMLFQCFVAFPIVGLSWIFIGHSMAFSPSEVGIVGDFSCSVSVIESCGSRQQLVFQMLFAVIANYVLLGALAERLTVKAFFAISVLWPLVIYAPVVHWVWGDGGWLSAWGAKDFAGGIVVHVNAGFAALAASIALGRRRDYFNLKLPSSLHSIFLGAMFIFLGWLGFNGGSVDSYNDIAQTAILNTLVAGFVGLLSWFCLEVLHPPNRTHMLGLSYGLICSLVAITPGAGELTIYTTLVISLITTVICFYSVRVMNRIFKLDDALDVFSSHGVAGFVGAAMSGFFIWKSWSNTISGLIVATFSFFGTFILFKAFSLFFDLRVDSVCEDRGLDISHHGEKIMNLEQDGE